MLPRGQSRDEKHSRVCTVKSSIQCVFPATSWRINNSGKAQGWKGAFRLRSSGLGHSVVSFMDTRPLNYCANLSYNKTHTRIYNHQRYYRMLFCIICHFKICVASLYWKQLYESIMNQSICLGNLFHAVGNAGLSNKMTSHMTDQKVFVIETLYCSGGYCVSVESHYHREILIRAAQNLPDC